MTKRSRTALSAALAVSILVSSTPAFADDDQGNHYGHEGLHAGETLEVALGDGATASFTPADASTDGAEVAVDEVELSGETAQSPEGEVVALLDAVAIEATLDGEDVSEFEHQVTIEQAGEDGPAIVTDFVPAIEIEIPIDASVLEGYDLATVGVYSRETPDDEWTPIPSAYDAERGVVVAHSDHLSEFAVFAAPGTTVTYPSIPRIALDPDDGVARVYWDGVLRSELTYSYAVAVAVEAELEATCGAEVYITRDASIRYVDRNIRANRIRNFDADIAMTLAFNAKDRDPVTGLSLPWGYPSEGGVVAWSDEDSYSQALGNGIRGYIPYYTGRPNNRSLNPPHPLLPYTELRDTAPTYAHAELLFIDHNYDWPVINTRRDLVVDAVVASLLDAIARDPNIACVADIEIPEPPDPAVLDMLAQLGENNYQRYGTDPVNLATGNFLDSEEVFAVTGVGDQVIDLTLAYNSLDGRTSPVGNGWNFAFSSSAQVHDDGTVLVTLADGRSVFFEPDGSGGYVRPANAREDLVDIPGGLRLRFPDQTTLDFTVDAESGRGRLTVATDRQGNRYTLAYGPMAAARVGEIVFPPLTSITDEAGQVVRVTSTPQGRITGFTHPDGRTWTLTYDGAFYLTGIRDAAGHTRTFHYNATGLLEVVTGADGVDEVTNVFDDDRRVVTQTDGRGSVREISYGLFDNTTLTDALGNDTTVFHNELGQVISEVDAAGGVTLTEYDEHFNPVRSIDALGNVYESTFDSYGRVTSHTNPLGETTTFGYNGVGDLVSVTSPNPNGDPATTTFVLNADGRAIETHLPDGTVTYATYDAHGDVTSTTNPNGEVTSFAYDARGNLVLVTDALGASLSSTYDLANRTLRTTDARGGVTVFVWDAADNLTRVTDAEGGVTAYTYDVNDSLLSETDPLGNTTTYEYNVNLQVTAIHRADGTTVRYEYDAEHRLIRQINADGTTLEWEYDALGRTTAAIDEAGLRWETEYDAVGNPVASIDPAGNRREFTFDDARNQIAERDPLGHTRTVEYNPAGLPSAESDELGRTTSFGYDVLGRLTTITTPDGNTRIFGHDPAGNLTSLVDERGFTTEFEVDELGRTVTVVDPDGAEWETAYDESGNVVRQVDPVGGVTTAEFDLLDHLVAVTDPEGGRTETVRNAFGAPVEVIDAGGGSTRYEYDEMNRIVEVVRSDGAVETTAYDLNSRTLSTTDPRGFTTTFGYDPRGLTTSITDPLGNVTAFEYDGGRNQTATVDPLGNRTSTGYDARNRPVSFTDAEGNTTGVGYDAVGNVTSYVNALGETTTFAYDAMDRRTSIETPTGATTLFTYDAHGNTVSMTNALGDTYSYTYDEMNRLVDTTDPAGNTEYLTRDGRGRITSVTDVAGNTTSFTFDGLSRQTAVEDAAGYVSTYAYDALDNLLSFTLPSGATTAFSYDARGRVLTETDALGNVTSFAYDASGNLLTTTDPTGMVTAHEYDGRNMLVRTVENRTGGAPSATENVTTSIAIDAAGRVTAVTDPNGHTTSFAFDGNGRVTAETDALGRSTSVVFDELGRPETVTAADGSSTVSVWDEEGFLRSVTNADGTVSYDYDVLGNRTEMVDAVGTTSWTHDWAGRVTSESDALGKTSSYEYDALGHEVRAIYPDGREIVRVFDERGLPVVQSDGDGSTTFGYGVNGELTEVVRPSGVVTEYTRDVLDRVTSIEHSGDGAATAVVGSTPLPAVDPWDAVYARCPGYAESVAARDPLAVTGVLRFDYAYDARGLVSERSTTTDDGTATSEYTYDPLGRLAGSVEGVEVRIFGWDAASNLVTETLSDDADTAFVGDGYSITRQVDAGNQLVTLTRDPLALPGADTTVTRYTYDGRGNRVAEREAFEAPAKTVVVSETAYVYDASDALLSSTTDGVSEVFTRDGLGRALSVTSGGVSRERVFDGFRVVQDGDTVITRDPFGNVLTEDDGTRVDVLADLLGSSVSVADGAVIRADVREFDVFGAVGEEPSWGTVTGFTGQIESESGVEFASRVLDPESRVWLADDVYRGTVVRSASLNRYAYVEGAPTSYVDVLGFFRAQAALRAQQVAAAEAAYEAGVLAAYRAAPACSGYGCYAQWQAAGPALPASHVATASAPWNQGYRYSLALVEVEKYEQQVAEYQAQEYMFARNGTSREREIKLLEIELRFAEVDQQIAEERGNLWLYDTVCAVGQVLSDPVEAAHMALDALGQIPVVGAAFDVINAGMYAAEGRWGDAGLSLVGAVPVIGDALTAARFGKTGLKIVNAATDMGRVTDDVVDLGGDMARLSAKAPSPTMVTPPKAPDVPSVKTPDPPDVTPAKTPTASPDAPAGATAADSGLVPGPNNALRDPTTGRFAPNPDSARQQRLAGQNVGESGLMNEVPAFSGGKTSGTLVRPDGSEEVLTSGWHAPAADMPTGTPGMNIVTKSHVEAHAATIVRNEELSEATLWINRAPCSGATGCDALLPRMVPDGSTLTINVVPGGSAGAISETIQIAGRG